MGTDMTDTIFDVPFTHDFVSGYDHNWNELSSSSISPLLIPSQTTPLCSDRSSSHELLGPGSFAVHSSPNTHACPCFHQRRDGYTIPVNYTSGQDIRSTVLLDTMQWSSSPSFVSRSATPGSQLQLINMGSEARGSDGFLSGYAPVANIASMPQVTLNTQVQDLSSVPFGSKSCLHGNINARLNHRLFQASVPQVPPSWAGFTNNTANAVDDQWQLPPVALYQPPAGQGSGRRQSKRACAINIEGLWIDKDDLFYGAGRGNGTVNVQKCLWDASESNDPCTMWVVGSRFRVGNHIQKWHSKARPARATAECLWDGCSKTMLKDSVNRHIVTVHFGERFHCRGCDQKFPRQDVYTQHTKYSEVCKGVGVATVYGSECRSIDARQALHREGMSRSASQ